MLSPFGIVNIDARRLNDRKRFLTQRMGQIEFITGQIQTVLVPRNSQGLAKFSRPVSQILADFLRLPALYHERSPFSRFNSPYEHGLALSFRTGDDIEAAVHAVNQVDITDAAGVEHRCCPLGKAMKSMGSVVGKAVVTAAISFGLDDEATAEALRRFMDEVLPQQARGQYAGIDAKFVSPPFPASHAFFR